jgi:hypothetical protein
MMDEIDEITAINNRVESEIGNNIQKTQERIDYEKNFVSHYNFNNLDKNYFDTQNIME